MARTVTINLVPGTPRTHLWCDRCMTSAAVEIDVHILGSDGPRLLCTVHRCTRCDFTDE